MYHFSSRSQERLNTVSEPLRSIILDVMDLQVMDFSILCGVRSLEEQKKLVAKGASRTLNSGHLPNINGLSEAVDIAPFPIDWSDHHAFHRLAGIVQSAASRRNIKIRWGGDWDRDNNTQDQSFIDLPHFELLN
jgi:peptidoglycan L-alanyl-D-glutamate endopeptidase CwlK